MNEIVAKLADSLSMFWQALDERERRLFALGVAWVVGSFVLAAAERGRKQREKEEWVAEALRLMDERWERRGTHG